MRRFATPALLLCLGLIFAVAPVGLPAWGDNDARREALRLVASQMLGPLSAGKPAPPMRLAVLPLPADRVPVTAAVAAELHAGLLAALVQRAGSGLDLVARESLREIIADMDRTGVESADGRDPAMAVLQRAGEIDVVALGRMRRAEGGVMLSYRLVRVNESKILASTEPVLVPLAPEALDPIAAQLSLDQALEQAARYFALQAGDMTELRLGGARFEDTGAQPPFGRFLQERLVAELERAFANPISGRKLKVRPARVGVETASRERDSYLLTGRYWDFGAALELRFQLVSTGGHSLGWRERVLASSAGPLRLRPKGDFGNLRDNDGIGPFAFDLTTDRGRDPAYRVGEEADFYVEAERDAYLYCFYLDAGGILKQFLPNPLLEELGYAVRIDGGRQVRLSENELQYLVFRISPPAGVELVKCFAASRNIAGELPPALRGRSFDPLPREWAQRLSETFRAIDDVAVNEASVVVTVHE